MANYSVNILDNGDGTWSMSGVFRNPAAFSSGGTNLDLVNNTAGFLQAATDTGDGLGHQLRNPQEAIGRAMILIQMDRAVTG